MLFTVCCWVKNGNEQALKSSRSSGPPAIDRESGVRRNEYKHKAAGAFPNINGEYFTVYHSPKIANKRKPKPAAPLMVGATIAASPFAVAVPDAAVVV